MQPGSKPIGGEGARPTAAATNLARANRRTALVLGLIAFVIYAYFILRHVFAGGAAGG